LPRLGGQPLLLNVRIGVAFFAKPLHTMSPRRARLLCELRVCALPTGAKGGPPETRSAARGSRVSEELLPIMSHHQAIIKPSSSHHQAIIKPSSRRQQAIVKHRQAIIKPSSRRHHEGELLPAALALRRLLTARAQWPGRLDACAVPPPSLAPLYRNVGRKGVPVWLNAVTSLGMGGCMHCRRHARDRPRALVC